jgi:hypothetical protein
MKRMSRGASAVRSPARSPFFTSAGPLVTWSVTPSSRARMWASDVFPSPGGPERRTWSSASPRAFAAFAYTRKFSTIFSWPTYSSKVAGRSDCSSRSSPSWAPGATSRTGFTDMGLSTLTRWGDARAPPAAAQQESPGRTKYSPRQLTLNPMSGQSSPSWSAPWHDTWLCDSGAGSSVSSKLQTSSSRGIGRQYGPAKARATTHAWSRATSMQHAPVDRPRPTARTRRRIPARVAPHVPASGRPRSRRFAPRTARSVGDPPSRRDGTERVTRSCRPARSA